jgi:hypothetical protein
MEGVLEQRSEYSSYRRIILPLKRIRYKIIRLIRIDKVQIIYLKLGGTAEMIALSIFLSMLRVFCI